MRFPLLTTLAASTLSATTFALSHNNPHNPAKDCTTTPTADSIIAALNLTPNPEKGYFTQTYNSPHLLPNSNRSLSTAIYYLLEGTSGWSHWHAVDAVEIWHFYAGAPLTLELRWNNGSATEKRRLGADVLGGERPQVVVEKGQWQRARSMGRWTLVGTTMAPGFWEEGFEMVTEDEGWQIGAED